MGMHNKKDPKSIKLDTSIRTIGSKCVYIIGTDPSSINAFQIPNNQLRESEVWWKGQARERTDPRSIGSDCTTSWK